VLLLLLQYQPVQGVEHFTKHFTTIALLVTVRVVEIHSFQHKFLLCKTRMTSPESNVFFGYYGKITKFMAAKGHMARN